MGQVELTEGQESSSRQAVKQAVISWGVMYGFEVILQKTDRERAVCRCKTATKDCDYVISAWWRSKLGKVGGFQIRMERTVGAGDIKRDMQLPSYI